MKLLVRLATGKVTRNVRRCYSNCGLQQDIASMKLALRRVGSSDNQSDHFTKLLPLVPFWDTYQ
jgi:hypothetical protein